MEERKDATMEGSKGWRERKERRWEGNQGMKEIKGDFNKRSQGGTKGRVMMTTIHRISRAMKELKMTKMSRSKSRQV